MSSSGSKFSFILLWGRLSGPGGTKSEALMEKKVFKIKGNLVDIFDLLRSRFSLVLEIKKKTTKKKNSRSLWKRKAIRAMVVLLSACFPLFVLSNEKKK